MSNNVEIVAKTESLTYFFNHMNKKELDKAERDALKKTTYIIKRATTRKLRQRFPKAFSTAHGGAIAKGLAANVQKSKDGRWYGQVHVMNSYNNDRGYLLKFYERGTKSRSFKGLARGKIGALWFFRDAVAETREKVFGEMEKRMGEAVLKQWNKAAEKKIL